MGNYLKMFDLRPGQYGLTKKFDRAADGMRLNFGAKRNEEFLVMLLGVQKKQNDTPEPEDMEKILMNLGWVKFDTIAKYFDKDKVLKMIEDLEGGKSKEN